MLQRLDFLCSTFDVYTDCNPLTYIKNTCKGNATGQRKINELTDYNFIIHYKTRVENVDADPLSRLLIRDTKDLKTYSQLCCADEALVHVALVFTELHVKMGDLVLDRTLQLIRDQIY